VFLAATLRDDVRERPGRAQAIAHAFALASGDPDALSAEAVEQERAGQVPAALQAIARAVKLAPWSPVARAGVLGAIGRCDEAVDAVQRALDVLPDDPPPGDVRTLVRERQRIRASCRPAGGP
jgi:predicted TPR repeat methyltransferase